MSTRKLRPRSIVAGLYLFAPLLGCCTPGHCFTLVDFEHDTAGNSIITGTQITALYAPWGLSFGSVASGNYGAPGTTYEGESILPGGYVGNSGHANHWVTSPNVVSFRSSIGRNWRIFRDDWAYGYVDFLNPGVCDVSIVASINFPSTGHNAYAVAWFDDGSSATDLMTDGEWRDTLSVSAPAGQYITRFEYHGQGFDSLPVETGAYFDNLTYQTPEPGSLVLVGAGLAVLALIARRRSSRGADTGATIR